MSLKTRQNSFPLSFPSPHFLQPLEHLGISREILIAAPCLSFNKTKISQSSSVFLPPTFFIFLPFFLFLFPRLSSFLFLYSHLFFFSELPFPPLFFSSPPLFPFLIYYFFPLSFLLNIPKQQTVGRRSKVKMGLRSPGGPEEARQTRCH